jgi:hypothetical protein
MWSPTHYCQYINKGISIYELIVSWCCSSSKVYFNFFCPIVLSEWDAYTRDLERVWFSVNHSLTNLCFYAINLSYFTDDNWDMLVDPGVRPTFQFYQRQFYGWINFIFSSRVTCKPVFIKIRRNQSFSPNLF